MAKSAQCINNLKQLANGAFSYGADFDGYLPFSSNGDAPGTVVNEAAVHWYIKLEHYDYVPVPSWTKHEGRPDSDYWDGPSDYNHSFSCPVTVVRGDEYGITSGRSSGTAYNTSYGAAVCSTYWNTSSTSFQEQPCRFSRAKNPSKTMLYLDARVRAGTLNSDPYFYPDHFTDPLRQNWRHKNRINSSFIDGHVQSLSLSDIENNMLTGYK